MAEPPRLRPRLRALGARLARVLERLGGQKNQEPPLPAEPRVQDRPWGGQSCPDLVQSSNISDNTKTGGRSSSEWDLRNWSHGGWLRRRSLGTSTQSLGRLQRPAVGSASDLARCSPLQFQGSGLSGAPRSPSLVQSQEGETSVSALSLPMTHHEVDKLERGHFVASLSPGGTDLEGLQKEANPNQSEEVAGLCAQRGTTDTSKSPQPQDSVRSRAVLTLPGPSLTPQQIKDDGYHDHRRDTPAFGEPRPAPDHPLSARTTCYLVTITLQKKRGVTPGEGGEKPELEPPVPWELKPAQPAPCPGSPEEFRGCRARVQAPPQEPRPITGCPDSWPWEPQLKQDQRPGRTGKLSELQPAESWATRTPGSLDRSVLQALSSEGTKSPRGPVPGPGMEEVGTNSTHSESCVVNATLTWRHRPPAQEEVRHRFHKVSLVSPGGGAAPQEESYAYTYHREEVNGITTCEEETLNSQGSKIKVQEKQGPPEDLTPGDTKKFLSHEPIFSRKYTPLPKDKRQPGRFKENGIQAHSSTSAPWSEMSEPSVAAAGARAEVPVAGPREASPHPASSSGIFRGSEERRITRTIRTTTVVGGRVERRTSSSVVMGPTGNEGLSRGRHLARTVRAVVVAPHPENSPSPSRSQALEILSTLVPPEPHSPKAETLRQSRLPRAIPRFQGPPSSQVGASRFQGQQPKFRETSQEKGGIPTATDITIDAFSPKEREVPASRLSEDINGPTTLELPPQGLPTRTSVPSSPGPQELSTLTVPKSLPKGHVPSIKLSLESKITPTPSLVKKEIVLSPGAPQDSSSKRTEDVMNSETSLIPFPKRDKVVSEPRPSFSPSLKRKEVDLGSGEPFDTSSTKNDVVPDSRTPLVPSPTKTEVITETETPLSPPPKKTEVVLDHGTPLNPYPKKTEVVLGPGTSLFPSPTKTEVITQPETPLSPPSTKTEVVLGPGTSLSPSPTKTEVVLDSGTPLSPSPTKTEVVLGPETPLNPSPTKTEVVLGPKDPAALSPLEAEASVQLRPSEVPAKVEVKQESVGEEEVALAADLELFLDTLRNMEAPEILRTHRLPRAPRSSYLAMYATLPAIDEDQASTWTPGPEPEAHLESGLEPEMESDEEPENPYLSDDEKLQRRQEKASPGPGLLWDSRTSRHPPDTRSPLDMMKLHVADAQGPLAAELGPWRGAAGALPSRLGGSLLFGGGDVAPPATLGAKLSSLRPHASPGLEKGPGRIPLLSNQGKTQVQAEAKSSIQLPEVRSWEEKEQGKLNTRPGKIILFSEPGCQGNAQEVWDDVTDATGWLPPPASLRVLRGGWLLYEKPGFQGQKMALPEGDMELRVSGAAQSTVTMGSLKRVIRDYFIPEISLFSKEGNEGVQVKLTEALEDAQGQGQPFLASSVTVTAGVWLLYSKPHYTGIPCILEPGVYPTLESWGSSDPHVNSLKPLRLGCPTVEKPGEPKALVYEASNFQGQCWEVSRDIYDLRRPEDGQSPSVATVGSLRILGGCWVGYEKEGFRGHQYLLEEGEYPDWSHWGGYDESLTSLRVIRTDFSDPAVILFEAADFEGLSVGLSEALPDVQLAGHGPTTQAIHVLSGVWVAYEQVGFSGEQYVLEKGVYRNCDDWGAGNSTITSLQPILQVGEHNLHFVSKIQLFSGPDFLGDHITFEDDQDSLPASFQAQSCRVLGGSWILFEEQDYKGEQHVLSEGEFPTLTAMGCLASTVLGSLQKVPLHFSEPCIFLYGLECFEGKEIELEGEVRSLQAEGFNNHVLSVRIKGGIWVLCEHSDFRGRQWLVGSTEITNWLTYSGTQRVGSLYPIKQRRIYFRLRNTALGSWLAVPEDVEDMKAGRVVVSETRTGGSCIWYYEDGLLKNQVAPTMSLQVIGQPSSGSKVVLWTESRQPRQTWSIDTCGHICSQMFEDKILDVKGGRGYDRDHAVLWDRTEDRPSQVWDVQVL